MALVRHPRALLTVLTALLALTSVPVHACNIPVFRYALDSWPSDPYRLTVFHHGPLTADQRAAVATLEKQADHEQPPVVLELVDLEKKPNGVKGLPLPPAGAQLPYLVVQYPAPTRIQEPVWSGSLTPEVLSALLDSPARREIARRILSGDSAVWVLLTSGNIAKDAAAEKLLHAEVQKLAKELKLPELTAAPEDKLLSDRPLKLAFSVLRVERNDPAETMLVQMLLNTEDDLPRLTDPMVFAVFGRGRAMPALVGAGITPQNIAETAGFLVGPCTCQVKRDNPGVDLLMTIDWGKAKAAVPLPVPATPGTSVLIPQPPPTPLVSNPTHAAEREPEPTALIATDADSSFLRRLLLAGITITGALAIFSGAMIWRGRRRPPS